MSSLHAWERAKGRIASHHPDGLNHKGLKRLCQSNMGSCAMLGDLCHMLSMHMSHCLPSCVHRYVSVICPYQHGRSYRPIGKVGRHQCRGGLRHRSILRP